MSLEHFLNQAARSIEAKRFEEALAFCREAFNLAPHSASVHNLLGVVEFELGRYPDAIRHFESALELAPDDSGIPINLAQSMRKAGRPAAAIEVLQVAIEKHPRSESAIALLSTLVDEQGDSRRAAQILRGFAANNATSLEFNIRLGAALGKCGDWVASLQVADSLIAATRTYAMGHLLRADAMYQLGRLDEACESYDTALSIRGGLSKSERVRAHNCALDAKLLRRIKSTLGDAALTNAAPQFSAGTITATDAWTVHEQDALDRIRAQLSPLSTDDMAVVFFHVSAGASHPFIRSDFGVDYLAVLEMAVMQARRASPRATIIVLTDEATEFGDRLSAAEVIRLPFDCSLLMYARMRSYRALVLSGVLSCPTLFLDTDVILNRDFRACFDANFDIGLTYRPNEFALMPINEGVILAASGSAPITLHFFDACLRIYDWLSGQAFVGERYGFDIRRWRGGQLSLAAFVGWRVPPQTAGDTVTGGVRIRFFECDRFNYAIKPSDTIDIMRDKWALHFKGAGAKSSVSKYLAYFSM